MSDNSHIEWTDATWNPTTGCTKVSEGCRHCYIDRTPAFRIGSKPKNGELIPPRRFDSEEIGGTTGVMLHPERLDQPRRWKRPRRIFVNSLSDLFHDDIPDLFVGRVFNVMGHARQHQFQVLTKHPRRMRDFLARYYKAIDPHDARPFPNVWVGTSVEDQKAADLRIPLLLETPAAIRFLSCEPLLGRINLHAFLRCRICKTSHRFGSQPCDPASRPRPYPFAETRYIDWVIVGGESGPKARPMHPDWARSLRDQCVSAGVPFFFKQWGEWAPATSLLFAGAIGQEFAKVGKKRAGRVLDNRTWDEMPELESA